jgi:hypothetical protein
VRVSPHGENVYTASFLSSALSVFARDPATGALKQGATAQARRLRPRATPLNKTTSFSSLPLERSERAIPR